MPSDRQYEFVYVLAPTVANAELETLQRELADQIGKLGGEVENTDLWGRRKLAYPIGNFTEGIYVVQLIRGPGTMVTELERRMRVHDDVLRYLTVRVDDDLRKARRAAEKRKADAGRRRAARGAEEEARPPATAPAGESPAEGAPRAEAEPPAKGGPPDEVTSAAPAAQPSAPAPDEPPVEGEAAGSPPVGESPAEGEPEASSAAEPPAAAASDEPAS